MIPTDDTVLRDGVTNASKDVMEVSTSNGRRIAIVNVVWLAIKKVKTG